jgi:hypothetical protein
MDQKTIINEVLAEKILKQKTDKYVQAYLKQSLIQNLLNVGDHVDKEVSKFLIRTAITYTLRMERDKK